MWKKSSLVQKIVLVIGLIFAGLISLQVFLDTENWLEEPIPTKKIEINESEIIGYDDGQKSFMIRSGYIWSTGNKYIFYIDTLDSGSLYDSDGNVVLDHIQAKGVRVNSRRNIIRATNNVSAEFVRRDDSSSRSPIQVQATELTYFGYNKTSYLKDQVVLSYDSSTIYADEIKLDHNENIVLLDKSFYIMAEDYVVSSDVMTIYIDENKAVLTKDVNIFRPAMSGPFPVTMDAREVSLRSQDVRLTVDTLTYHEVDDSETKVILDGAVHLSQTGKILEADYGEYYKESELFIVSGNVSFEGDSLEFFVKKEQRVAFQNEDVKASMAQPFHITCEYMRFNMKDKRFIFEGDVLIVQKDKRIQCDRVEFDDASNKIYLTGHIIIEHDKDVFKGESLVLDLANEAFWTEGPAIIDFYLSDSAPSS